jgi:pimeloyl-ACP methyl ester carboxylesterase
MKLTAGIIICISVLFQTFGQEAVYYYTDDSVKVRADLYLQNNQWPFIILCHEEGSNRSDYYDIAPRLLNLNYNCLAVDLRTGGKTGYTENETASLALLKSINVKQLDAGMDITASIRFVQNFNKLPVVLLGSTSSASLCLLASIHNPLVKAVIALSPGEYFQPLMRISSEVGKINRPVFAGSSQKEYPYILNMLSAIPSDQLTIFKPENDSGENGIRAFLSSSKSSNEYWFALAMFFKKLE